MYESSDLRKGLKIVEMPITYSKRDDYSKSKLNIISTGPKILYMIFLQFLHSLKKGD